jgi:hypothetical protein
LRVLCALKLTVCRALALHGAWLLSDIHGSRRNERVLGTVSVYFPAVIVQQEVMVPTEQNPVRNVCGAVIPIPLLDVVGFAPRWRSFATAEPATTISCGEGDALGSGEHPLFATNVERLKAFVEHNV